MRLDQRVDSLATIKKIMNKEQQPTEQDHKGTLIIKQDPENVAIKLSNEETRTILVYLRAVREVDPPQPQAMKVVK